MRSSHRTLDIPHYSKDVNRRTYLAGATGAVAFLGGCIGAPAAEPGGDPTNSPPDGEPTTGIDTPEGDIERTAKTKTETVDACNGVRSISFYGLESDEADELWGPSTVRAAFALGAGANVRLAVLEDDTVLGTTLIPPPDGAVAVDGQPIPLDTDLSGDHTIRVVVYPHSGESDGFDIERTTPCRHKGNVVQTEPTTIDFDRFSLNTSSS